MPSPLALDPGRGTFKHYVQPNLYSNPFVKTCGHLLSQDKCESAPEAPKKLLAALDKTSWSAARVEAAASLAEAELAAANEFAACASSATVQEPNIFAQLG